MAMEASISGWRVWKWLMPEANVMCSVACPMAPTRDIETTRSALSAWLARRLGVEEVEVGDIGFPKAGFSNETLFVTASWHDGAGGHREELVLRIEPTAHQLFVQPDAMFQA